MTTVCVEKPERHKGVMGWYGSSSKSKEVFTWTIVGPKSPIDDTMYVARWTVTSDGVEESWGKPFNERNLAGEQTTKTTQGVASGVSEMEIDYDDEKGIDIDVVAGPVAADDRLIIAERVMGAGSPSFSMVKRPLLIAGGFSHATFANGTKLKGRTVSGSKSETGDNCKTTLQWRLTDNGVH